MERMTRDELVPLLCQNCARPVLEFSVDNDIWNAVIGNEGGYLCIWCWDARAARAGVRYEAQFWFVGAAGMSALSVVEPQPAPSAGAERGGTGCSISCG